MALSRDVVIRLLGDASSAEKAIKSAADAAEVSVAAYRRAEREQTKQAASAEAAARKMNAAYESVGKGMMIGGAVIAAGLGLATKAAIDWESAWAGVTKTVNGTPAQMDALEKSLRGLATTLPATHEEIAGVAEAAGQLGVARGDIVEFTKVAIAMGVSTNLSADEAATGMARLSNIMGTSNKDVDRMGAAMVALGNAGASTEGEILDMSLRIGAAGRQAGFSAGEVMGLANAMSSLGIEAEAGGTAISQVIKTIGNAVSAGGDDLDKFAKLAGVSSSAFAKAWREDASGALVMVVRGLGKMHDEGKNVNTVIDDLGLGGIRTSDTLLRLAGNADGLADSLTLGNKAWADNTALMNEANKRYETTASKIAIARNQITDAAIDIGGTLLPVLASGAELIANFTRGFQDLPGPVKEIVTVLGILAATVGLVGGASLIAIPKLAAFRVSMEAMQASSNVAVSGVGKFGAFMAGPWGAAIGVATLAIGGLITWLGASGKASASAASFQKDLAAALRESGGAITENTRALAANKAADEKIGDSNLLEVADKAGISLPRLTDALLGNRDAYNEVKTALLAYQEAHTTEGEGRARGYIDAQGVAARDAAGALDDLTGSMGGAVAENERLASATKVTGTAADTTATTMDDLRVAQEGVDASGQKAQSTAEKLAKALDDLNGPTLNLRDATRNYQQQIDDIDTAMGEKGWTKTLDNNTEAGRKNNQMLDDLAKKGQEQATAILNTTGSYDAFKNSLENSRAALIKTAIDMGASQKDAEILADSILDIPDVASVDIKLPTYAQVTGQLVDVYNRIKDIPPQTWTNIGVISGPAIAALEGVGYKTRTLPDGTVEVYADTSAAESQLRALTATRRVVNILANVFGGSATGGPVPKGLAVGGPVTGPGGPRDDMVPAIGNNGTPYRLSDREWIIQASSADMYGPAAMAAVNSGRAVIGYAGGGGIGVRVGSNGGGMSSADVDRIVAAIASSGRSGGGVQIGTIVTQRNETGYELAQTLAFEGRTR